MDRMRRSRAPTRRAFLTTTLCAGVIALTAASPGTSPEPRVRATQNGEIVALVAQQAAAWNSGNADLFAASFAENGSFTNIRGVVQYGRDAFRLRHQEIFASFFRNSQIAMTVTKTIVVREDVVIADITTVIDHLDGRGPPGVRLLADGTIHTRLQEVFVRRQNKWYIISYHNVDVKGDP
jgi:uncharacterized protein (TIGR02246 family)